LIDAVIGANAPELQRKIMLNLDKEKKILKEGGERAEVIFKIFYSSSTVLNVLRMKKMKQMMPDQLVIVVHLLLMPLVSQS
jgi:hypothetical protein